MAGINPKLMHIAKHRLEKMLSASLADELREQYKKKTVRVVKGDSVMVIRGEYKGRGGKVEKVNTGRGTLHIEGMQREKIRGGQVKVPIHASNVKITALNLEDKQRANRLQGIKPETVEKKEEKETKKAAKMETDK